MNNQNLLNSMPAKPAQLLAAFAAALPMALLTVWMYVLRDKAPGISEFFLGPLLFGGGMIFWMIFLNVVFCRDSLAALGFGRDRLWGDVAIGCVMGMGLLGLKFLTGPFLTSLFPPSPPSEEIFLLIRTVAADPWLLALWLGPVVWIGIAGFEEFWRVFVLRRLWLVFPGRVAAWPVLIAVSTLIGLAHGYQGPAAILSIGFKSVLMGWYFMKTRRIRPLIVAHAVYDSVQIVMAVIEISAA
jgi:membrane protease YdiL (CAAX protease family)